MTEDRLYLLHIQECLSRVAQYTSAGRDAFLTSPLIQDAVLRNLQIMAESSQKLSDDIKQCSPGTNWRGLAGLRNILVHNYLGVDLEIVWNLIVNDAPMLAKTAQSLLDGLRQSP